MRKDDVPLSHFRRDLNTGLYFFKTESLAVAPPVVPKNVSQVETSLAAEHGFVEVYNTLLNSTASLNKTFRKAYRGLLEQLPEPGLVEVGYNAPHGYCGWWYFKNQRDQVFVAFNPIKETLETPRVEERQLHQMRRRGIVTNNFFYVEPETAQAMTARIREGPLTAAEMEHIFKYPHLDKYVDALTVAKLGCKTFPPKAEKAVDEFDKKYKQLKTDGVVEESKRFEFFQQQLPLLAVLQGRGKDLNDIMRSAATGSQSIFW